MLLGWLVDWPGTLRILRQTDARLVLVATVVIVLALVVSTLKWQRLASAICGPLPFPPLLRAYWIGTFLSNYLPSNIGGDVVRVLVLRARAPLAPLAGSVLAERLTGVTALALISAVCLAIDPIPAVEAARRAVAVVVAIWPGCVRVCRRRAPRSRQCRPGRPPPRLVRGVSAKVARFGEAVAGYRCRAGGSRHRPPVVPIFYALLVLFQFTLLRAVGSTIPSAMRPWWRR